MSLEIVDHAQAYKLYEIGYGAISKKDYHTALDALFESLRLAPGHAPTSYLVSRAYEGLSRPREALESAKETLALCRDHTGATLVMIRALAALALWHPLVDVFDHLPESLAVAAEPRLWRALAAHRLGEDELASELYSTVSAKIRRRYPEVSRELDLLAESG